MSEYVSKFIHFAEQKKASKAPLASLYTEYRRKKRYILLIVSMLNEKYP
jgi:hypothetical protein